MSLTPVKVCKTASAGKVIASIYSDNEVVRTINYFAWEKMTGVYYAELIEKLLAVVKKMPGKVVSRCATS